MNGIEGKCLANVEDTACAYLITVLAVRAQMTSCLLREKHNFFARHLNQVPSSDVPV